ncbi:uncharacterized protein LOC128998490 [Macrosteles quadrilineatus]|uniref:uncharacterized protein LOC128998490 n=1 Tax=Macrosteles quadrilineatus TaxID=74068 RepID=UPI0023E32EF4|nr:uncharacterized protein LOC128998490 [Macrosteles quadrilineatus]XP_054280619.1 uncharacterized protein LOC128998490 [Macrosteles quadrilineatus]
MSYLVIILSALVGAAFAGGKSNGCYDVDTIDRSLRDEYCDQPLFVTFLPKSSESELLDNICYTYFPLPDDPDTFQVYISRVFCDGSNDITSFIGTQIELGVNRKANPFCTLTDSFFGYAGCDTYLAYRCYEYGDCSSVGDTDSGVVLGFSPQCRTIGLSCLRKVEEIVRDNCLPDQDYYVLPMKLPNRCVTQQLCLQPPNPFYGALVEPVRPYVGLV